MQKANGVDEAGGLCREEFQWFMRYFVDPLLQKAVTDRMQEEPNAKKYMCMGVKVTYKQLVEHWHRELASAYDALTKGYWKGWAKDGHERNAIPMNLYLPTATPYFLSFDRSTAHSFWLDRTQVKHLSRANLRTSLLQLIRICPDGHDIHQTPEHAIGCIKGHVGRGIAAAVKDGKKLTMDFIYTLVHEGKKLFTADSWDANLERCWHALNVIARDVHEEYCFTYKNHDRQERGTAGNYAPMYLS